MLRRQTGCHVQSGRVILMCATAFGWQPQLREAGGGLQFCSSIGCSTAGDQLESWFCAPQKRSRSPALGLPSPYGPTTMATETCPAGCLQPDLDVVGSRTQKRLCTQSGSQLWKGPPALGGGASPLLRGPYLQPQGGHRCASGVGTHVPCVPIEPSHIAGAVVPQQRPAAADGGGVMATNPARWQAVPFQQHRRQLGPSPLSGRERLPASPSDKQVGINLRKAAVLMAMKRAEVGSSRPSQHVDGKLVAESAAADYRGSQARCSFGAHGRCFAPSGIESADMKIESDTSGGSTDSVLLDCAMVAWDDADSDGESVCSQRCAAEVPAPMAEDWAGVFYLSDDDDDARVPPRIPHGSRSVGQRRGSMGDAAGARQVPVMATVAWI